MNVFSELLQDTQYELSNDDRIVHCLLRGKEIRNHKSPLLHDCTEREFLREEKRNQRVLRKLKSLKQTFLPDKK